MDLVDALGADEGVTCLVGAGGKKSTLFRLATGLPRAVVTATVRIPIFDRRVAEVALTDDPVETVRSAERWPVGVVPDRVGDRYEGYAPATIDALAATGVADAVLVKADGARTRWLKAPGEDEPRIPSSATTVVPVASVRVVGEPLDDRHVHRPERVAEITGLARGSPIGAADVAAVLASDDGGLRGVPPAATTVPLLNMVDDPDLEATAREIAEEILDRTAVGRVVLARMIADDPVVAVVES